MQGNLLMLVNDELNALSSYLEFCMLNEDGVEVAAVIVGYASKEIFDKSKCDVLLTTVKLDSSNLTTSISFLEGFNGSILGPSALRLKIVYYFRLYQ